MILNRRKKKAVLNFIVSSIPFQGLGPVTHVNL